MSAERSSPLAEAVRLAGGVLAEHEGARVARHFGDPAAEYRAATSGMAVFDLSHRARWQVTGREPRKMLDGILAGTLPEAATAPSEGVRGGRARYSVVLTPKGKMVTDLWALLLEDELDRGFLLDVPAAGAEGLMGTFAKYLPPRLAKVVDVSDITAMITVVGPSAAHALSRLALGSRVEPDELAGLEEGEWRSPARPQESRLAVVRTADVWPSAFHVLGSADAVASLWRVLLVEDARPAGAAVWSTLRVEAGRPAYGVDMDESTIPVEAGVHDRGIDYVKGCYTGQEVIVRIRDRGHVNRHLRRLELGDVPAPAPGTELFADGSDRPVGRVTSAVESPRYGGVVALVYVRRGVERVVYEGREVAVPGGEG